MDTKLNPAPKPGEQKKQTRKEKVELSQGERQLAGLLVKRRKTLRELADLNRQIDEITSDYETSEVFAE